MFRSSTLHPENLVLYLPLISTSMKHNPKVNSAYKGRDKTISLFCLNFVITQSSSDKRFQRLQSLMQPLEGQTNT